MSKYDSCPTGKVEYMTQAGAWSHLEKMDNGGFVYRCTECGHYHIASGSAHTKKRGKPYKKQNHQSKSAKERAMKMPHV